MVKLYDIYCNKMRRLFYDKLVASYTEILYRRFLESCMDNTTILDIGIGNGSALCKSADVIKNNNLRIVGIDICDDSLSQCAENVRAYGLEEYVEIGRQHDVLYPGLPLFDYAFMSNSYSVIDEIKDCIDTALSWTKDNQCVISLALFNKPSPILSFIKRNLKHILGFDCGRYITHTSLVNELDEMGVAILNKEFTCSNRLLGFHLADIYTLTLTEKIVFVDDTTPTPDNTTNISQTNTFA